MRIFIAVLVLLIGSVAECQIVRVESTFLECTPTSCKWMTNSGTGIVIARANGFSYVVTTAHTFGQKDENPSVHGLPATILARKYDQSNDLAVLRCKQLSTHPLNSIAKADPKAGDSVTLYGLGSGNKYGVGDWSQKTATVDGVSSINTPSRHGDSGGPVMNGKREVCGLIATTTDRTTGFIPASRITRFLADCRCVPLPQAAPKHAPPPPIDIPDRQKTERIRELEQRLANLETKIAGIKNGRDGADGKNGKDATIDYDALAAAIAKRLPKRRIVLTEGNKIIDDESYDLDEPIVLDINRIRAGK
jgi:hypothetical protein